MDRIKPSDSPIYFFSYIVSGIKRFFVALANLGQTPEDKKYLGIGLTIISSIIFLLIVYYYNEKFIDQTDEQTEKIFKFVIFYLVVNILIFTFVMINYNQKLAVPGLKGAIGKRGPKGDQGISDDCNICTRRTIKFKKDKPIAPNKSVNIDTDTSYNTKNLSNEYDQNTDETQQDKLYTNNDRWKQDYVSEEKTYKIPRWVTEVPSSDGADSVWRIERKGEFTWWNLAEEYNNDNSTNEDNEQKYLDDEIKKRQTEAKVESESNELNEAEMERIKSEVTEEINKFKLDRKKKKKIILKSNGKIVFNNGDEEGNWGLDSHKNVTLRFNTKDPRDEGEKTITFKPKYVGNEIKSGLNIQIDTNNNILETEINFVSGTPFSVKLYWSESKFHTQSTIEGIDGKQLTHQPINLQLKNNGGYASIGTSGELVYTSYMDSFEHKPKVSCGENCEYSVQGMKSKEDIQSGCNKEGGQCGSYLNGIVYHTFGISKEESPEKVQEAIKNSDVISNGIGSLQFRYAKEKIQGSQIVSKAELLGGSEDKKWGNKFNTGGIYRTNDEVYSLIPETKSPSDLFLSKYDDFTCPVNPKTTSPSGIYKIETIYSPKEYGELITDDIDQNQNTLNEEIKHEYPGHLKGMKIHCKDINTGEPVKVKNKDNEMVYGYTVGLEPNEVNAKKNLKLFKYTCNNVRHNKRDKPSFISSVGAVHGERVNALEIHKCSYNTKN